MLEGTEKSRFSKKEISKFGESRVQDIEKAKVMAEAEVPYRDKKIKAAELAKKLGVEKIYSESTEADQAAEQSGKEYDDEQERLKDRERHLQWDVDYMIEKTLMEGDSVRTFGYDNKDVYNRMKEILESRIYKEVDDGEGGTQQIPNLEGMNLKTDADKRTIELQYDNPLNIEAKE